MNASRALRSHYNVVGLGVLPHNIRNLNNSSFNLLRTLAQFRYKQSIGRLRAISRAIELHVLENNLSYDDKGIGFLQNNLISKFEELNINVQLVEGLENISTIFDEIFQIEHSSFKRNYITN